MVVLQTLGEGGVISCDMKPEGERFLEGRLRPHTYMSVRRSVPPPGPTGRHTPALGPLAHGPPCHGLLRPLVGPESAVTVPPVVPATAPAPSSPGVPSHGVLVEVELRKVAPLTHTVTPTCLGGTRVPPGLGKSEVK